MLKTYTLTIAICSLLLTTSFGVHNFRMLSRSDSLSQVSCNYTSDQGLTAAEYLQLASDVVTEHSTFRTDPSHYNKELAARQKNFGGQDGIEPKIYIDPKTPNTRLRTSEGWPAVDIAIDFLTKQANIGSLERKTGLDNACVDHVAESGPEGLTGHNSKNGEDPNARMGKYGTWGVTAAENLEYGSNTGKEVVLSLIIDDGVPGRGHRVNIFNPKNKVIGCACGFHCVYKHMCACNYAGSYQNNADVTAKVPATTTVPTATPETTPANTPETAPATTPVAKPEEKTAIIATAGKVEKKCWKKMTDAEKEKVRNAANDAAQKELDAMMKVEKERMEKKFGKGTIVTSSKDVGNKKWDDMMKNIGSGNGTWTTVSTQTGPDGKKTTTTKSSDGSTSNGDTGDWSDWNNWSDWQ